MKKILFIATALLFSLASGAQDAKYMSAMEKNVGALDSLNTEPDFSSLANSFERIGNANPKEWLPLYYQAFCTVQIGMKQSTPAKMDEYFDKAEVIINKADQVSPENSEIVVVQSWINSMKIGIDPMTRGQKLGMRSAMLNEKAIKLNPENPRAYFLKGSGLFHTPENYGGGKDKACPVLQTALEKFKAAKNENAIMPKWGQRQTEKLLEKCK
jgi:hypothetical protein